MLREYKYLSGALGIILIVTSLAPFFMTIPGIAKNSLGFKFSPPGCLAKKMIGKECPSCGLTRSIVALYNGDWELSDSYHRGGKIIVVFIFLQVILRIIPILITNSWIVWVDLFQLILLALIIKANYLT
ncbi:MAG: DUF2752 domain-containing protein [Deltaproteobacteria bacterium]|nr:DUF2752 domain-containing protein [Deltaproteobacteria bacterium]MBM4287873.1 DUF2752 domain-containing protein [Deltaproteobacteria bacterium]